MDSSLIALVALVALVALGTLAAVALIRGGKEPETINVSWRIHNMNGKPEIGRAHV